MQSITVNGPAATYLKGTRWEHSIKFEALFPDGPNEGLPNPAYLSVRMAVTAFEGQTAPPTVLSYPLFTDLKLDGRLTNFSGARAFKTSRGRGNYYRMVQQWLEDPELRDALPPASCVSQVDMRVTILYIHEEFTQSVPFLTGLFDDVDHQPRGFARRTVDRSTIRQEHPGRVVQDRLHRSRQHADLERLHDSAWRGSQGHARIPSRRR